MRAGFLGKLSSSLLEAPHGETDQAVNASKKLQLDSPPLRSFPGNFIVRCICPLIVNVLCYYCFTSKRCLTSMAPIITALCVCLSVRVCCVCIVVLMFGIL